MSLNFKRLENLLIKNKDESNLVSIIFEYLVLKQKIDNLEKQSWYFKKGIESSKKRLISLTEKYNEIRKTFNESTIGSIIEKINENLVIKSSYEKNGMNTIQHMHYSSIIRENETMNELLHLKSKIEILMPFDHYLNFPDEILKLVE